RHKPTRVAGREVSPTRQRLEAVSRVARVSGLRSASDLRAYAAASRRKRWQGPISLRPRNLRGVQPQLFPTESSGEWLTHSHSHSHARDHARIVRRLRIHEGDLVSA